MRSGRDLSRKRIENFQLQIFNLKFEALFAEIKKPPAYARGPEGGKMRY
jgi:hypothetical protein